MFGAAQTERVMPRGCSRRAKVQLQTKGCPELGHVGHAAQHQQDAPDCQQGCSKEVELYTTGFWWCTMEAWERGLHLQLPLQRVSGAILGETECAADVVQAATATTSLHAGREKAASPSL